MGEEENTRNQGTDSYPSLLKEGVEELEVRLILHSNCFILEVKRYSK